MATRDEMRAATLGENSTFTKELITYGGYEYELREPALWQRTIIMQKSKITGPENSEKRDLGLLVAYAVVQCVYKPGTEERVYEDTDVPGMLNRSCHSWVSLFGDKILNAMNVKADEAVKN